MVYSNKLLLCCNPKNKQPRRPKQELFNKTYYMRLNVQICFFVNFVIDVRLWLLFTLLDAFLWWPLDLMINLWNDWSWCYWFPCKLLHCPYLPVKPFRTGSFLSTSYSWSEVNCTKIKPCKYLKCQFHTKFIGKNIITREANLKIWANYDCQKLLFCYV